MRGVSRSVARVKNASVKKILKINFTLSRRAVRAKKSALNRRCAAVARNKSLPLLLSILIFSKECWTVSPRACRVDVSTGGIAPHCRLAMNGNSDQRRRPRNQEKRVFPAKNRGERDCGKNRNAYYSVERGFGSFDFCVCVSLLETKFTRSIRGNGTWNLPRLASSKEDVSADRQGPVPAARRS